MGCGILGGGERPTLPSHPVPACLVGRPPYSAGKKYLPWKIARSETAKAFRQPVRGGIGRGVSQPGGGGAGTSGMFQVGR